MFRGFLFCLRFRGQFSEVLHHGVGIDFANWVFELSLKLPFEFSLTFEFALELGFEFVLGLVCHDPSSLNNVAACE
jgi:hypothetical protein